MSKVNSILNQRMKQPELSPKMDALAQRSATGNLTSFSGMFQVAELGNKEKQALEGILLNYAVDKVEQDIQRDLSFLISITSEVKAINNQAALLHGERIKKAHTLLTKYRDGAFTAWLMTVYGNRQTPYNLMQYFEFYEALPKELRPQIELMPRQAVYTLASAPGDLRKKQEIVEKYQGETKLEMLTLIRKIFPLKTKDQRKRKWGKHVIHNLKKMILELPDASQFTLKEKKEINELLKQLKSAWYS